MNLDFRSTQAIEGAHAFALGHAKAHTCSECRYAQPFATQPRGALCERVHSGRASRAITLGLPACELFVARRVDLGMAVSATRHAVMKAEITKAGVH